ncbi:MAG: tRNA pseudouridine(55) synthase TruB [Propionibacteriales bacterium]|nr:tRNA pseudouridine(55) synthase TruB [Propionibacteriales bacterium]
MSDVPSGIVVVDKPPGWTSHDVVARVRRLAGTRRVGHAGTLDPMATGVLVLGVGRATRLLGHLAATDKEYAATIRLGESTITDDAEGETAGSADASGLDDADIRAAAGRFVGHIEQVPSAVSAVKVDGRRAYQRVRAGEDVVLKPRSVHVAGIEISGVRREGTTVDVDVSVTCSSGTYIRALARDIGSTLGVGGHLTRLRRTRVGVFSLAEARSLEESERGLVVVPLDEVARRAFATYGVNAEQAVWVTHGRPLRDTDFGPEGPVAIVDPEGRFLALYEQRGRDARALAVFAADTSGTGV